MGEKIYVWDNWPPHLEAQKKWEALKEGLTEEELEELGSFYSYSEYLNARLAYRRYINKSPSSETT